MPLGRYTTPNKISDPNSLFIPFQGQEFLSVYLLNHQVTLLVFHLPSYWWSTNQPFSTLYKQYDERFHLWCSLSFQILFLIKPLHLKDRIVNQRPGTLSPLSELDVSVLEPSISTYTTRFQFPHLLEYLPRTLHVSFFSSSFSCLQSLVNFPVQRFRQDYC